MSCTVNKGSTDLHCTSTCKYILPMGWRWDICAKEYKDLVQDSTQTELWEICRCASQVMSLQLNNWCCYEQFCLQVECMTIITKIVFKNFCSIGMIMNTMS